MKKLGLAVVLVFGFILIVPSKAQDQLEVAPYQFATIPVEMFSKDVKVYKVVHQGCELFVSVTTGVRDNHSSIATGRGCK